MVLPSLNTGIFSTMAGLSLQGRWSLGWAFGNVPGRIWVNREVKIVSTEHLLCTWLVMDPGETQELGTVPAFRVQAEEQHPSAAFSMGSTARSCFFWVTGLSLMLDHLLCFLGLRVLICKGTEWTPWVSLGL